MLQRTAYVCCVCCVRCVVRGRLHEEKAVAKCPLESQPISMQPALFVGLDHHVIRDQFRLVPRTANAKACIRGCSSTALDTP